MTTQTLSVGDVELCLETFGRPGDPAVLLISGAAASMGWWEPSFCRRLADGGRFVVRYDHRDTGGSTSFPAGRPGYPASALQDDALRLLDTLGIERAHLVGVSMGGGITQALAASHPGRLLTMTLIATTAAGERTATDPLPPPEPRVRQYFDHPPPLPAWDDERAVVDYLVETERVFAGSLQFDEERMRRIASAVVRRTLDLEASLTNHWVVAADEESPPFRLAHLTVPTLVLHGTADPMFPLEHGRALAQSIPGARLVPLEGMGHQVPPRELADVVVAEILRHTE
jgi:pimeloyl-ACP methyl ester carboxylesterase